MLADFSPQQQNMLKASLPEEGSIHNPIDVLGDAAEDRYKAMLDILEKDKQVGTILNILTPQEQTPVEKIAEVVVAAKKKSKKMMLLLFKY